MNVEQNKKQVNLEEVKSITPPPRPIGKPWDECVVQTEDDLKEEELVA